MKILFLGHVCMDKNVVRGETETLAGGGVLHGAITARRLGAESVVLTKCAEADRVGFEHLAEAGVEVTFLPSAASTSIRNVYPGENPDDRKSFLISRAAPFTEADVQLASGCFADIIHVNPLWFGEFPPELMPRLRAAAPQLAADAQGFLRVAAPDGTLSYQDFAGKTGLLPLLDLFKVDSKEALLLTGESDPTRAARAVHVLGPKLVLLTHQGGACAFDGQQLCQAPFSGYTLEGRTGRGDTCTASFLVGRSRAMSLQQATTFAAEITSAKMQYRGPYRG